MSKPAHRPIRPLLALATLSLLGLTACSSDTSPTIDLPAPPVSGNILDSADLLTDAQEDTLNQLIDQRNTEGATRVAIYTTNTSPESDLGSYATALGNAWGVGDANSNNGTMIVIDMEGRENYIALGEEHPLSNSDAQRIAQEVLSPPLSNGDYNQALTATVSEVYSLSATGGNGQNTGLILGLAIGGIITTLAGIMGGTFWASRRKIVRAAEAEMQAAKDENPGLSIPDEMRRAYINYRRANPTPPAQDLDEHEAELRAEEEKTGDTYTRYAPTFNTWMPLYIASPVIYSGSNHLPDTATFTGGTGYSSGSSFGGGSFSGGGGGSSF